MLQRVDGEATTESGTHRGGMRDPSTPNTHIHHTRDPRTPLSKLASSTTLCTTRCRHMQAKSMCCNKSMRTCRSVIHAARGRNVGNDTAIHRSGTLAFVKASTSATRSSDSCCGRKEQRMIPGVGVGVRVFEHTRCDMHEACAGMGWPARLPLLTAIP